jgi:ubiquinone/menaquinone biosynthesis C-methylase UbiE
VTGYCHKHGQQSPANWKGALDPDRVLEEVGLQRGQTFLDAGCGEGRFAIPAASMVGIEGVVYGADTSQERVDALQRAAKREGLGQIETFVADVTERIPVPPDTVDVCLVANVLHGLAEDGRVKGELQEIRRVLKPPGILAIVDFKKDVERPPGPPLSRRLDPEEVAQMLAQYGFRQVGTSEMGKYHYLSIFALCEMPA